MSGCLYVSLITTTLSSNNINNNVRMYILIIGLLTDGGRGPVGPGPAPLDPLPYLGAEEVAPLPIQGGMGESPFHPFYH